MTSKRLVILLILLSVSISLWAQTTAVYPAKKGAVSDYAGKLSDAQIKELTGLIRQFEKQTSIEFAVVVVDSLQGRSVRDYAIGLGDAWGVGKAGRNNGIVLLWAPNERSYSLRIADGLTADLSDGDAKLITQRHLLPYFKRGDYYAGLKETVEATMAYVGDQPWEERMQARGKAAEQQRQIQAQAAQAAEQQQQAENQRRQEQAEQTEHDTRIALIFLLVVAAAGLVGFAMHRWRQSQRKLAELATANQTIADVLSKAESNAAQIQRLLDDFSKESPEQDLTALRADLAGQPDRITKIKVDATLLDVTNLRSYEEMVGIRTRADAEAGLLEKVQGQIGDIRFAKQQSQALLQQLSKENFQISDVRNSSRREEIDQLLLQSRQDYQQARQNSSMSVVDWLIISDMLNRSHSQVQQAVQYSQEEPYVPSSRSSDDSSGSSFLGSMFSGGSGSSGSSSFGGDSGGDSGGGGGFSGGSGSDGSY